MPDSQGHDPQSASWDPTDPEFAELLAAALAGGPAEAGPDAETDDDERGSNGAPHGGDGTWLESALEALGEPRLEGESAAAWIERLLANDALRAHLADVGTARLEAQGDDARLRPCVRDAALAAFDEDAAAAALPSLAVARAARTRRRRVRAEPLHATGWRPAMRLRTWVAAAALVLVAVGASLYLLGSGTAEAGLQLTSLSRVDLAGSVRLSSVEPRYFASLGRVFTPAEDELLSFEFGHDTMVVVGAGDALRVARSPLLARIRADRPDVDDDDAVLRLEAGEARLATEGRPILLAVDRVGILVLVDGAAHVAFDAGDGTGTPAVARAEGGEAVFYRAEGAPVPLAGPSRVRLAASGEQAFGEPARSLFRDLRFFGGALPAPQAVRFVAPRLWRVVDGAVRRERSHLRLVSGPQAGASTWRLAWRPEPVLADAVRLKVSLRAPADTTISLPGLGADGAALEATVTSAGGEPGVAAVEIPLPYDWFGRLDDGALHLVVTAPAPADGASGRPGTARKTRAWFDGVSLALGASAKEALERVAALSERPREGARR